MGSDRAPLKSQARLTQRIRRSVGACWLGTRLKESGVNRSPHHGQFSSGTGPGLRPGSRWKARNFASAESGRVSPIFPSTFGVAALPTHRPISNGHSP